MSDPRFIVMDDLADEEVTEEIKSNVTAWCEEMIDKKSKRERSEPQPEPNFGPRPPLQPHPYPSSEHANPAKPAISKPVIKPTITRPVLRGGKE